MILLNRWYQTCQQLSITPDLTLFNTISQQYAEPTRHYHTLQHLTECFYYFDLVKKEATNPAAIEMAIWLHDIIYDVKATNNETLSAKWAATYLTPYTLANSAISTIQQLIKITDHQQSPQTVDEQIIVDVDLAILGSSPHRFAEYEQQIRTEYSWVPYFLYRKKRKAILAAFLKRPVIYHTNTLNQLLEKQARINLKQATQTS